MSLPAEIRPAHGRGFFIVGALLLAIAVAGIVVYATGLPDLAPADGSTVGLLRGATVVGAAICGGSGALLIALGVVKRRSAAVRGLPED